MKGNADGGATARPTAPAGPSRRTALKLLGAVGAGASIGLAPGIIAPWWMRGFSLDPNGLAGEGTLRRELEGLIERTPGALGVRRVAAEPEFLYVDLLCEGFFQSWSKSAMRGEWTTSLAPDPLQPWDTPTAPLPAELPLGALQRAYERVRDQDRASATLAVDDALRLQLSVPPEDSSSDDIGLDLATLQPVPALDLEHGDGIGAALAEILASHAPAVRVIGSFNGFVHVDGAVDGLRGEYRIVRDPTLAPRASCVDPDPADPALAFDPTALDPTLPAVHRDGVGERAGVAGTVWDWEFRRPGRGRDPGLSFGIGESGPTSRVWVGPDGAVLAVEDASGACLGDSGWCAG